MKNIKSVTVYSTTWCPYCKMEEDWLLDNDVAFKTILIDEDETAATYIVEKSGQRGVPVTEVKYDDDTAEYVIGFDRPGLSKILELKK